MALFSVYDLNDYLRQDVNVDAWQVVERVVHGWLKGATGLTQWPDPLPDDVFSWALELAAIAYENPVPTLSTESVGGVTQQWQRARKAEILAAAAAAYGTRGRASGSFPDLVAWPDPAIL